MSKPIGYNAPQGVDAESFLSDELIAMLKEAFVAVTDAFGDDATLYKIDIGKIIESAQTGGLIICGQFVDRSDGEVIDFEINQGTGKVGYQSAGDFLDQQSLSGFLGEKAGEEDKSSESSDSGPYPFDLLLQAINEESSEAYQSPFASRLRKDLDYLGALSALMYHAGATIEAQPLYTGLHGYAIKYALRGLRLFSQSIGSLQGEDAGNAAEAWVDEHGLDFAAAVIKEFSSRRCVRFQESIQAEDQDGIQELKTLVEEAIGMAMATTTDLIKSVLEADDYRAGDVQATLAAAIEEYCPIDNSEGYSAVENARQLSEEWQEVVNRSGCSEDLSMQALGLPPAQTIPSEQGGVKAPQIEATAEEDSEDDQNREGERIFYVNVGEGPSRNWDDCRKFGFLAAGGGRKWSKQLEKIKTGDTVIAYLKGYGYVGIGKITATATPATKFMVNGVPIKELPLINDTIRSIKRFSKENGEYLIGVDWEVAVPRENAAWKANEGLYTTALVCASLRNQSATVKFVLEYFRQTKDTRPSIKTSQAQESQGNWEEFHASLVGFLESNIFDMELDEIQERVASLHTSCPGGLFEVDQSISIRTLISENHNNKLIEACKRLTKADDEALALFLIGICELGDNTDKILEQFLDLVDDGINLNTLVCEYVPHNVFEVNALVSLICWPEMPDWARAHLVTRDTIGLTSADRDSFIEYLGNSDVLDKETLLAICRDYASSPSKYSSSFIKDLTSFLASDLAAISNYNSEANLAMHLADLGEYCVFECKRILGLEASLKQEANNKTEKKATPERLIGNRLIERIRELNDVEKDELIRETGYFIKLQDGSEELLYEDFYQALLEAKGYEAQEESMDSTSDFPDLITSEEALNILANDSQGLDKETEDTDFENLLNKIIHHNWKSEEEFALFFINASISMANGLMQGGVEIFGHEISYSFYPGTTIWDFWTKARRSMNVVDNVFSQTNFITDEIRDSLNITSIFNVFPAALNISYNHQSLGEWLAHGEDRYSHEDNEFLCTFLALALDNDAAILDIVCNLRSPAVLDELVFCNPEFLLSDELLLDGYFSNQGLLFNRALSENSLVYLSALLLAIDLPQAFNAKTEGDLVNVSVGPSDVDYFRNCYDDSIKDLNLAGISDAIGEHQNCPASLAEQLNRARL